MTLDLLGELVSIPAEVYALLLMTWFVLVMFTGLYFDGAFVHEKQPYE